MSHTPVPQDITALRVDAVLIRSFAITARNFAPFGVLALLFIAPTIVFQYMMVSVAAEGTALFNLLSLVDLIVTTVLGNLLYAALVYGTIRELRGNGAGLVECVLGGLKQLWPVVLLGIVVGLLVAIGLMLFVVPGVIIAVIYWVAIPASVVEGTRVGDSLRRSAALTRGHRWPVFWILLCLYALLFAGFAFAGILMAGQWSILFTAESSAGAILFASLLLWALYSILSAVAGAVTYHDLRIIKEGAGIERTAAIFD